MSLGSSLGQNAKLELRQDHPVIGPAVSTAHGLCHSHILPVPLPGDDVVNKMPMLRAGCIHDVLFRVGRRKLDHGVGDDKVMRSACLQEQESVAVTLADTVSSDNSFPGLMVYPCTGIKIPENNELL